MTVIKNDRDELISTRTITEWYMYIDYHKLNQATRKDHFSLSFIDYMLERLAMHSYFYYLEEFFQFLLNPYPYGWLGKDHFYMPLWHLHLSKDGF